MTNTLNKIQLHMKISLESYEYRNKQEILELESTFFTR
jgi:hypothetical protein